jgi:hypothetical protein
MLLMLSTSWTFGTFYIVCCHLAVNVLDCICHCLYLNHCALSFYLMNTEMTSFFLWRNDVYKLQAIWENSIMNCTKLLFCLFCCDHTIS